MPVVCVWEVATGEEVCRIVHEAGDRGIVALAFGPGDGGADRGAARLVTVSSDNKHTTRVWDWGGVSRAPPRRLCAGIGFNGTPPQIHGAVWSESADRFATFGAKHVKLWTPTAGAAGAAAAAAKGGDGFGFASSYTGKVCAFGKIAEASDGLCGAFLPGGRAVHVSTCTRVHVYTCQSFIRSDDSFVHSHSLIRST